MAAQQTHPDSPGAHVGLGEIVLQWGRIGCIGFGGPPVHISLLRRLCVSQRRWLSDSDFERALAASSILPGPSSTQLSIYCAWRLRGARGAVVGGLSFILPGLILILGLSALFLAGSPPRLVRGAGMGAGCAVAAVAVRAGLQIAGPMWQRAARGDRWILLVYALAGALATATLGTWLVLVLLGCGALELTRRRLRSGTGGLGAFALPVFAAVRAGRAALVWTALKVGALAFGGGFVIVPLMQSDAVGAYHWMSHSQFLCAVALGQVTPGPLVQTVAAVGYAAGGVGWGLLAAAVAFLPSFSFVMLGAGRYQRLLSNHLAEAFLAGAAPASAGAIVGSAVPLTLALGEGWQYPLLGGAALALLVARLPIVPTLLACGAIGALLAGLGAPVLP